MSTLLLVLRVLGLIAFATFAIGAVWLAWEQATVADHTPDNDLDIRRRYNAAEIKRINGRAS